MSESDKKLSARLLSNIYHEMPAISLLLDGQFNIQGINDFGLKQLGYAESELLAEPFLKLYAREEWQFINQNLIKFINNSSHDASRWECTRQRSDGSQFWARDTVRQLSELDENGMPMILMLSEDISETRYLINELKKSASTDVLTGLINRRQFERHLDEAILSTRTGRKEHTLCYIDLDQFKVVNDVCGHLAGDELLRQISSLMKSQIRGHDILGRLGGDEFGLILHDCPTETAFNIVSKILDTLLQFHFRWDREIFKIGASIGTVSINAHHHSASEYLKMADTACYTAKEKGRKNIQTFNHQDSRMLEKNRMQKYASRINWALENNRFELHFQKIASLNADDIEVEHIEILLRLRDELDQLIFPGSFIPAAEYYGLSTTIDLHVTRQALEYFQQQNLSHPIICNINLSGKTLSSQEFIDKATKLLQQQPVEGLTLCFEITETAAISNFDLAIDFIDHFNKLGCLFALDDFGSGFSSFSYLKSLQIHYLKIDGHFIKNLIHEPRDLALVKAIHQVAQAFDIQTIAEFVESRGLETLLKGLGISYAQGYHIHKPENLSLHAN